MSTHELSEAERTADELEAMGTELHRKAASLRAAYGVPLDPKRKVEFLFHPKPKNRTKKTTTPGKVS